jgi:hypothetical protein
LRNFRQARYFLDRIFDSELVEKVVEDDPIGVERGAGVETLRLAPRKELLNVLGRYVPRIGFRWRVFGKEFQDVRVLLVRERFAERADVLEELVDHCCERQGIGLRLFFGNEDREPAGVRFEFETLSFLSFEGFGGSDTSGLAEATAIVAPFDQVATVGR